MVNRNRWSWSGGPGKTQARDDVATSQLPLVRSPEKPDLYEVNNVNDSTLQPTATSVSSRRMSRNRWSWRPDTAITVTPEDQQETQQGGKQDGGQDRGQANNSADSTNSANIKRRLSKHFNKTETACAAPDAPTPGPAPLPLIPTSPPFRSRPRPSSMIAPASASFDTSPSYRNSSQRWAQQQQHPQSQQQDDEEQPAAGVKNVFSRLLNRRLSLHGLSNNSKSVPMQQQQQQHHPQAPAKPTPPPSLQQQHREQRPLPMQSPMRRHGPQLHNPQNTIRVPPAPPVTNNTQTLIQGHIGNGRVVAPLPGLDENEPLQLSPSTSYPSTAACVTGGATGAAAAQSLESGTASSSTATSSPARTEGLGLFGRLMRRRLAVPKEKDATDNLKRPLVSTASIGDNTSHPSGADKQMEGSPDADPAAFRGANEQRQIPPQKRSLQKTHGTSTNETASPDMRPSPKSRFLRQVTKPQKALAAITPTAGAAVPRKSKSHSHLQQNLQQSASPASPSTAEPRLRSKPSYGKRFWSRAGANNFGQDNDCVAKTNTPAQSSPPRAAYIPKHAAADFSRTTNTASHNRHSFFLGKDLHNGVLRPLATIAANAQEDDEPEPEWELEPRKTVTGGHRTPSAEQAEKRESRDLPSSTKYEAPSPMELHRRLEIVKSSEVEVVTTREPATADSWQHQLNLLRDGSNTPSSSNGKTPAARSHSRPRSSQRHSFNLVSDPYARELTPPKSASPVEMEAPFDPPSQTPQQVSSPTPPRPTSFHARPLSRQDSQSRQPAAREMSDFERFLAEAEVADREHHAQMWRNLARRSGHYGYSNGPWSSVQPVTDPFSAYAGTVNATAPYGGSSSNNMNTKNKRHSAYYSVGNGKRASMMSFATAFEERKVISPEFYGQPPTVAHSSSPRTDKRRESLQRQGSVSKRISAYIKPPKPSQEPTYENWPAARGNRRSVIAGATEG